VTAVKGDCTSGCEGTGEGVADAGGTTTGTVVTGMVGAGAGVVVTPSESTGTAKLCVTASAGSTFTVPACVATTTHVPSASATITAPESEQTRPESAAIARSAVSPALETTVGAYVDPTSSDSGATDENHSPCVARAIDATAALDTDAV
jgi:hypothetical protein